MPRRSSVRGKLFAAFVLMLLPLLASTVASFATTREELLDAAVSNQQLAAEAVAGEIDTTLDAAIAIAWAIASDSPILSLDRARLETELDSFVAQQGLLDSVRIYDAAGRTLGHAERAPGTPTPRASIADRDFFHAVLATNTPVLAYVRSRRDPDGIDGVIAIVPVRDEAGRVVGAAAAVLLAETLRRQFHRNRLLPGQDLILLDPEGTLVLLTSARTPPEMSEGAVRALPPVVAALAGNPSETRGFVLGGEEYLGAFVPTSRHGWVVGVTMATRLALQPAQAQLRLQLLSLGAVVALSLVLSLALARWIGGPVSALTAAAGAVAAGDLSRRVHADTRDELARLAEAFNGMADAIQQRDAQVRAANEELEARVLERTAELSAAVRDLESFSFTVAHDLRAPLRAIDGFAFLLFEQHAADLSPEALGYLERVRTGARRMSRLIDDLLAFSRLGRMPLTEAEVDVEALAEDVLGQLRSEAPDTIVEIGPLPPCRADPAMFRQVLVNLLGNALKYSRPNPAAKVTIRGWLEPDGTCVYEVRDNGVGFDMRHADKLFRPFERLHGPEFEGTGVGLAIVDRIVGRHGGTVSAVSRPGEGATFTVRLPA
ncbi:MAG: cache domain-containing protein [Pseudomonadota bacterium]|nr:cache domain-containing protein [Pseudomonadota bacterium]